MYFYSSKTPQWKHNILSQTFYVSKDICFALQSIELKQTASNALMEQVPDFS